MVAEFYSYIKHTPPEAALKKAMSEEHFSMTMGFAAVEPTDRCPRCSL